MKTKSKISFIGLFLFALIPFSGGLRAIAHSMAYGETEYNFIADNWIFPSTLLLALIFALGWWGGSLVEYLLLNDRQKFAILTFFGILLFYGVVGLSSILDPGFLRSMLEAGAAMILSSFFFRLSVIRSEVIDKLRKHN